MISGMTNNRVDIVLPAKMLEQTIFMLEDYGPDLKRGTLRFLTGSTDAQKILEGARKYPDKLYRLVITDVGEYSKPHVAVYGKILMDISWKLNRGFSADEHTIKLPCAMSGFYADDRYFGFENGEAKLLV